MVGFDDFIFVGTVQGNRIDSTVRIDQHVVAACNLGNGFGNAYALQTSHIVKLP